MRVLVLGGYGLIGGAVVDALIAAGHEVSALGRDIAQAATRRPEVRWIKADLAALTGREQWTALLRDLDAVVNAAGALQDGARDNVAAVQSAAMRAIFEAAASARISKIVQISAVGASKDAATAFMRTKGEADAALQASGLDWVILRPALVLAPTAYGATALLRALAAFPIVIPFLGGAQRARLVSVEDVAKAAVAALDGRLPARSDYDIAEGTSHRLDDIVLRLRAWLGYAPVPVFRVPGFLGAIVFRFGDMLGWLGWRTPLRSTTLAEMNRGVGGDPSAFVTAMGYDLESLDDMLRRLPSTAQERWYARAWLVKPVIIATLAAFWLASGLIALLRIDQAALVMTSYGASEKLAYATVTGGALIDVALGGMILVRRTVGIAALGMMAVTAIYLVVGSLLAPNLWLDPLGAYVKTIPAAILALAALALNQER